MDDTQGNAILQLINKKQFILDSPKDVIMEVLSRAENQNIINRSGEFRARTYTPIKTLHSYIQQVLSADKSSSNAVSGVNISRLISEQAPVCPNTGSYIKARKRLSEDSIHDLVKSLGDSSLKKIPRSWCFAGHEIKVFDGTTLTLPDTKANNEQYPKHSNARQGIGNPQVRLLAVFSLITGSVIDYALEATKGKGTGETTLLRGILDCFKEGDIALGDALFCNFFLTHDLIKKKVDIITPGHIQRCYDFNEGIVLDEDDHITQWKKPRRPQWMSKEAYKDYPDTIQIREFKVNGVVYMTPLRDATAHPKKALHTLYKRRWEVELHLRSIKTVMGMDRLACETPDMVRKEIGVHLLAYNIIREIMMDGCLKEDALPTQISFKGALHLLNQFSPHFITLNKKKKAALYLQMLTLIVKNKVGKRPGRVEPRAIRKRTPSFPVLRDKRKVAIDKLLEQRNQWLVENGAALSLSLRPSA